MVNGIKLRIKKSNSMVYFRALPRFRWEIYISWWKNKSCTIPKKSIQLQPRMVNGTKLRIKIASSMVNPRTLPRFWWKIYSCWWKNKSCSISKNRIQLQSRMVIGSRWSICIKSTKRTWNMSTAIERNTWKLLS
jgi:hypothetical protein